MVAFLSGTTDVSCTSVHGFLICSDPRALAQTAYISHFNVISAHGGLRLLVNKDFYRVKQLVEYNFFFVLFYGTYFTAPEAGVAASNSRAFGKISTNVL